MSAGTYDKGEVARVMFGWVRDLYQSIEKAGSIWSKTGVKAMRAHLKRCVDRLYVEEQGGGSDRINILRLRQNWQTEYYDLMVFVTSELNAAYAEYERERSSGLSYQMYESFVEILSECRVWMKQSAVVCITEEEYKKRMHPQTASTPQGVPQSGGGGPGPGNQGSIFEQVDVLKLKI